MVNVMTMMMNMMTILMMIIMTMIDLAHHCCAFESDLALTDFSPSLLDPDDDDDDDQDDDDNVDDDFSPLSEV